MIRSQMLALLLVVGLIRLGQAGETKISVEEPSGVERKGWPVTSGVPFAAGALANPQSAALFTGDGMEVPLQTEVLSRWPDGSVRWLLLDFQVDLKPKEKKALVLRFGPGVGRKPVVKPLLARKNNGTVTMDAGPVQLDLGPKGGLFMLSSIWFDKNGDGVIGRDEGIARGRISLQNSKSRSFYVLSQPDKIAVEQNGPVRACVRIEGSHLDDNGDPMFRYIARIHVFRGQPFVRIFYTFVADQQDSLMAKIKELSLRLFLSRDAGKATYAVLDEKLTTYSRLLQIDENNCEIGGQRHARRAAGWTATGSNEAGFAIGLREFWQNWPKGIRVGPGEMTISICPELYRLYRDLYAGKELEEECKLYYYLRDGLYTFKVGAARTHELWATFFSGKPEVERLSAFFRAAEDPLLATCDPAYVSETKAAGEFPPADAKRYSGYDTWLSRALDDHLRRRDKVREYGMMNYGDWWGERQVNWGNLEYDLAHGMLTQYLRTGDRRFFLRGEQAARHHIDVDVVHATNPHVKSRVGEIWLHCVGHTGGYYRDAPLPVDNTYQMGTSTNFGHVWDTGDLDYYLLTGDRRALEVSLEIADAMVSHMPTSYGTHIRALGWPMILVLSAYDVTGNKKYLDAATQNWLVLKKNIDWQKGWLVRLAGDHCLHPEGSSREEREKKYRDQRCIGNVPFMEGLTLCALARYHRITRDPEALKAMTVGIDQMIRECWQEDVKTFRYTACPLSSKAPYGLFLLSAEAMAYEAALTGNKEHLRILREGLGAAIKSQRGADVGKSLGQMIFFSPYALSALGN
ncbi:hypothetical protein FJY63_08215 [Candidatus Sumerlaeota bacterium]|nr:hypothetical protein [Candidatus Sumerlaeota bacterium]